MPVKETISLCKIKNKIFFYIIHLFLVPTIIRSCNHKFIQTKAWSTVEDICVHKIYDLGEGGQAVLRNYLYQILTTDRLFWKFARLHCCMTKQIPQSDLQTCKALLLLFPSFPFTGFKQYVSLTKHLLFLVEGILLCLIF